MRKKNPSHSVDAAATERGDIPMEWQGHLEELRSRFLRTLVIIVVLFVVALSFAEQLFSALMWPFREAFAAGLRLNYSYMGESIVLTMQCALFAALFAAFPWIVVEIWRYVKPALALRAQKAARPLFFSAFILFYLGAAFSFFFLIPASVSMIIRFSKDTISSYISSTNYLSFLFTFCAASGALFEMPVALSVLAASGAINPATLIKKRKYVIVGIWIVAAVITPPDILSQTLVAIPLMLLYEISLLAVRIICRKKLRAQRSLLHNTREKKTHRKKPVKKLK